MATTSKNSSADHAAKADWYARSVVDGSVPAGKWVRAAARRHLADLAKKRSKFEFVADRGARVCRFIEKLPHTKGKWAANHESVRLEPWQCFLIVVGFGWLRKDGGKRRFRTFYWEIPRKNGKALAIDTPIATADGWKCHGDLAPGDRVFSPSGHLVEVQSVTPHYDGPCMAVQVGDETIVAHERHEWATKRTWYTMRPHGFRDGRALPLVETQQMRATLRGGARGDFVHRIPIAAPMVLPEAALAIPPYTLGAWLGDGTARSATITFADDEIRDQLVANGVPCRARSKRGKATLYALSDGDRSQAARNAGIASRLRAMGLLGNKRIPTLYLRASLEQRRELMRGLIDTDGHVTKRGQVEIVSVSRGLAADIAALVRSLGMKPCINEDRASLNGVDCGPRYRVLFFPLDETPLAYVQRKRDRQRTLGSGARRSLSRTVTSVDPVGNRVVNCIQVEGGMYLAGEHLVPTHNSLLAAGVGLYMLLADGEYGAEVYSGATSEKQAWEVFKPAKLMLLRAERLRERLGSEVWAKALVVPKNGSKFEPVIGNPGDGASPSCAIIDEYHEHQTPILYDTMETGMGAREQPLLMAITTAGSNVAGPCHEKHDEVCKVLEGTLENDELFGCIFGIDLETDDWADPKSLIKANPNYGVSVDADFLLSQQRQAMQNPLQQNRFKTKHLNTWTSVLAGVMNMQQWALCGDPMLDEAELAGTDCWIALDLASKSDLCAEQRVYRKEVHGKPHYYLFGSYWLPEEAIEDPGPNHAHYVKWVKTGLLTQTDGATVDFELITETVIEDCKRINPREVIFDPFNAVQMMQAVMAKNITAVEFIQTPQNFVVPLDELVTAVKDGRFHHDGNELTAWCMSNMVARPAKKGLISPIKAKPHQKIDGAIAAVMAVARASAGKTAEPVHQMFFV